jgi:hypothetical protein
MEITTVFNNNLEYTSLLYHKQREQDLIRDAEQHRLAQVSQQEPEDIYRRLRRALRINNG